jgi:hypothetical protein
MITVQVEGKGTKTDDLDPDDNGGYGLLNVFGPKINGDDPLIFYKPIYDGQAC